MRKLGGGGTSSEKKRCEKENKKKKEQSVGRTRHCPSTQTSVPESSQRVPSTTLRRWR